MMPQPAPMQAADFAELGFVEGAGAAGRLAAGLGTGGCGLGSMRWSPIAEFGLGIAD